MMGPVAVAVSGGIDSLVAAYLLQQQGLPVVGLHFLTGYERWHRAGAPSIGEIGGQLGIPVETIDLTGPFQKTVVDYFTAAYQAGETPNPCLVCNPMIKFGVLLDAARRRGATHLATGHYARVDRDPSGHFRLYKGRDAAKDQSYFLSRLTRAQLPHACFPLGTWTKDRVREVAGQTGLSPVSPSESQDVCFIRDATVADFIVKVTGRRPQPGDIVDRAGNRVGRHAGLHRYTIGQRRGINIPASQAYYVLRIDCRRNRLVVGFKDELNAARCRVRDINWIAEAPAGPIAVETRIRYRHQAVDAVLRPHGIDRASMHFQHPQAAVTPGQGAVFYRGDEVLGSGWIE